MKCWICGNIADSEEHKFKASLIKKWFGKKYGPKNPHVYVQGEIITPLESYKSKLLKFPKVICIKCNNDLTKPHDNAFDIFTEYSSNNYQHLLENRIIDFESIYGRDWQVQRNNFYKYLAKHAGCKIVTGNKPYDVSELAKFIKTDSHTSNLYITFDLKEGINNTMVNYNLKYNHLYNSITFYHDINQKEYFAGWITFNSFSIVWIYSNNFKLNTSRMFQSSKCDLNISYQNKIEEQINDTDPQRLIKFYEYGGEDTLENLNKYFTKILEIIES